MQDVDAIFTALAKSAFRRRFHLQAKERAYLGEKGLATVLSHAEEFVRQRLAAAQPHNDGKQTPYRGHPVFIAQHATACCCRGCLAQWHGLPQGVALDETQVAYIVAVLERWLRSETRVR